MKVGDQKVICWQSASLSKVKRFTIVVGDPMEAEDEDDNEDPDALYHEHVQGEASFENESEEEIESYSEEELERKREEALEEIEEMIVKALGLDDGPNFKSEQDLMEWFEEVGEDELEELREYQLEQMPDSNGCVLTNYEEGPDEREDELTTGDPPDIPNGHGSNPPPDGGTYGNHVPCTEDESPYDYLYECLDEHSNAECDVICHGNEEDGGCGLTDEYWDCVGDPSVVTVNLIVSCAAGCIVTGPKWPACVKGCLTSMGIAAGALAVSCLFAEGAYEC